MVEKLRLRLRWQRERLRSRTRGTIAPRENVMRAMSKVGEEARVVRLGESHIARAADMLAHAFADDPA